MAVSKRTRYEVLRRDNHACRYCGATAPDVMLQVDHVIPTTLGGSDDPDNLVAACRDCNSGKSSSAPDASLVDDVATTALRWSSAITAAGQRALDDLEEGRRWHDEFDAAWSRWTINGEPVPRPDGWRSSVDQFRAAGLPEDLLLDSVRVAMENDRLTPDGRWSYLCGVAWKRTRALQDEAANGDEPVSNDDAGLPHPIHLAWAAGRLSAGARAIHNGCVDQSFAQVRLGLLDVRQSLAVVRDYWHDEDEEAYAAAYASGRELLDGRAAASGVGWPSADGRCI